MAWAPDYVTAADLKAYVRISDTVDDAILAKAISAASRAIDQFTGRQFGSVSAPETRHYTGEWDRRIGRWVVFHDDVMSVSGFGVQTSRGIVDAYDLKPVNNSNVGLPWTHIVVKDTSTTQPTCLLDDVAITAVWGWSTVPVAVQQATLLQASRLFSRRTSPFGVAGSPDLGNELRLLAQVDPDVAVSLRPYIRWWAAA